jgi:glutathionylspermidine synthase
MRGCYKYRRIREKFFAQHHDRWPGTLADAFDILAACPLVRSEIDEILEASRAISAIYRRGAELLRCLSDEALLDMGVPDYLLPAAKSVIPGMVDCVIGRLDLARTTHGYKLLEFNSDAPGLLVETFSVNAEVCRDAGKMDPNESCDLTVAAALIDAVRAGVEYVRKSEGDRINVAVTSRGKSSRDRGLAMYVCRLLDTVSAKYVPIEMLDIDPNGLYDPNGDRIDILYRVFPLQLMRNRLFRRQNTCVNAETEGLFLRLVESRRLAVINPPFAFLLESKALQAVIWNLFESGHYFSHDERGFIANYMLPTYLDPPEADAYVIKPIYGAGGDTVVIVNPRIGSISQSACTTHAEQSMVYQKYVKLPTHRTMTEYGPKRLHVVASCFLVSGRPAGICMRAGEAITDESAWVMPVCIAG